MSSAAAQHLRPHEAGAIREALDAHVRYVEGLGGGRRAQLVRADLSNWNLEGAQLAEADLAGACLAGAVLAGADLSRLSPPHAAARPIQRPRHPSRLPPRRPGAHQRPPGPAADLRDADLRWARLARADLRGACLRGANLSGADLTACDLREGQIAMQTRREDFRILTHEDREGTLDYAVAAQADLARVLVAADCREASLAGACLAGARMAAARLDGADLTGAQMAGADLTAACLRGAVVAGANL
ncbi:MAG TPA: pentapeptide repeat-containing protein, partial [Phenylobacterium sp.]|nr:pentapeptide repeat-containing protein [Phenylobacterium sp.]